MKKLIIIITVFSALLSGCEKSTDIQENRTLPQQKSNNSGIYPTTYNILDSALASDRRSDYLLKNRYLHSSLNPFGFCDWNGDPVFRGTPPYKADFTESEAIRIIKEFVKNNSAETGIVNPDYIDFSKSGKETGYAGSVLWHFRTKNQRVDNVEILHTSVLFDFTNTNLTLCLGNWYPEVYIPESFNYDEAKAKSVLIGHQITRGGWGGPLTSITITEKDLGASIFDLKILPVESSDKIELRVCWVIAVPSLFYDFYIDVMTGELLLEESLVMY